MNPTPSSASPSDALALDKALVQAAMALGRFQQQAEQSGKGLEGLKKQIGAGTSTKEMIKTAKSATGGSNNQAKSPVASGLTLLLKSLSGGSQAKPDAGRMNQIKQEEELRQNLALEAERKTAQEGHKLKLGFLQEYASKSLQDTKVNGEMQGKAVEAAGKLAAGDKKGAAESLGNLAGSTLGGMYGGPAGAAVGGAVGTMAGSAIGNMMGGGSKPQSMGPDFAALREGLNEFAKQLKENSKSLEQNVRTARRVKSKLKQNEKEAEDLKAQEAAELHAFNRNKTNKSKDDTFDMSKELNDKIHHNEAQNNRLREQRVALTKKMMEYSAELGSQIKDIDDNKKKFLQDRKETKFTASDWNKELRQARNAMERMQERPKNLENEVAWQSRLLELKKQEEKALEAYLAAKDQEIEQIKSFKDQFQQLGKGIEDWRQGKQRQTWGSAEWTKEIIGLDQQIAQLNPQDAAYQKTLLDLQQKQFQALQNIDAQQGKELEETKKLVKTLQDAQKTAMDARDRLALKGMSSEQQLGYYDQQYQNLLAATQSGTEDERAKAVTDFSAFTDTYLSQYQAQFKSGSQYQSLEQQVLADLDGIVSGLQGQINQANNSLTSPRINIDQLTDYLKSGIEQSGRTMDVLLNNVEKQQKAAIKGHSANGLQAVDRYSSTLTTGKDEHANLGKPQEPATAGLPVFVPNKPGKAATPRAGANLATVMTVMPPASRQGSSANTSMEQRLDQQIRLLGELIDVERAKSNPVTRVLIDGQELQKGVLKSVSEGNRRGVLDLGV